MSDFDQSLASISSLALYRQLILGTALISDITQLEDHQWSHPQSTTSIFLRSTSLNDRSLSSSSSLTLIPHLDSALSLTLTSNQSLQWILQVYSTSSLNSIFSLSLTSARASIAFNLTSPPQLSHWSLTTTQPLALISHHYLLPQSPTLTPPFHFLRPHQNSPNSNSHFDPSFLNLLLHLDHLHWSIAMIVCLYVWYSCLDCPPALFFFDVSLLLVSGLVTILMSFPSCFVIAHGFSFSCVWIQYSFLISEPVSL